MQKLEKTYVYSIGGIIILVVVYWVWPYLVGFLAVVGGFQIYRVWRQHGGKF